jgi:hypothetical protein
VPESPPVLQLSSRDGNVSAHLEAHLLDRHVIQGDDGEVTLQGLATLVSFLATSTKISLSD